MKQIIYFIKRNAGILLALMLLTSVFSSCQKNNDLADQNQVGNNEAEVVARARSLETTLPQQVANEAASLNIGDEARNGNRNIVEIALSNANFSSLVAAVVKTGLAGALSDPSANLTVFAPTNAAFASLPAPFNNAANINAISDAGQVDFLRNVLLYHVIGAEVFSSQVSNGRSSAPTLKPASSSNDNTLYLSKTIGIIRLNGNSTVILPNVNATNGVVHVINKVLLFPTNNIAEIAITNPGLSSLVAALVKTNLAPVFFAAGDYTVFAPTDAAFSKLPAPFNNASNISSITDASQIAALSNILRYHVFSSRYFNWDLGILSRISTLADAPNNKLTTVLGFNTGWVKGDKNNNFSNINPGDILATNGVIHVINDVLLPK